MTAVRVTPAAFVSSARSDSVHRTTVSCWPAGECHHGTRGFRPVTAGQQLWHDRVDLRGGQMQHKRRTRRRERLEVLPRWHRGRQRRHPRQRHRLRDPGHGEFASQHRCCGGERRYAGHDLVVDAQRVKASALFGERAVDRRVTRVQPRHVEARGMGIGQFGDDLVEGQRAGVEHPRVRRAQRQQVLGHDRAGVQTDWAAAEQPLTAHGDQIGGAGPGPDEVDGHCLVTDHCVTGIAGRQPVNPPTGSPR